MHENTPMVSVIIPAYNEVSYIGRLLEALAGQRFEDFEVVVSDADSGDGTDEVVDRFRDRLPITLVTSPPRGPGGQRNEGAKHAVGTWLLFLDADNDIADPDFIATLVRGAEENGWQTASAKVRVQDASRGERFGLWLNYTYVKALSHTKKPVAGGCILTRRTVFEEHGGFNERIRYGEDYDYVSRVGFLGFGFVEKTSYFIDLRRSRAEGWRSTYKAIANEVVRFTRGLENGALAYEFGKHEKRS